jgi:recombination protein RecA
MEFYIFSFPGGTIGRSRAAENPVANKASVGQKEVGTKDSPDRERSLELALSQVEKAFGKGAIMRMGESGKDAIEVISTGSLSLDLALGVGGLPKGRITEIYGPESGGKTTLALHCVAEAQKAGGLALYIDAEHALDTEYARQLGVDVDKLYISQPSNGEEALEIADAIIRSGAVDIVVVDSVAALVPRAEIEGEMGDSFVGIQARMMSQALRKLGGSLNKSKTAAIFINQLREKIGVMYGNPETTPGGRALKFWASVRLEVRKGDALKSGAEQIGARTKVKVVKNKVAPPFRTAEFDMIFGQGISRAGDILDIGATRNLITRSGTYFNYGEIRLGQGRDNARTYLEQHSDVLEELDKKIRVLVASERAKAPVEPVSPDDEEPDDSAEV